MTLSSAIALLVFPLYLVGGRTSGVHGLALASATAISLNALVTVVWLRSRAGAPDPLALATTLWRGVLVAVIAGLAATLFLLLAGGRIPLAFLELALGGAVYGAVAIGVTRLVGDEPMRAGLAAILARLRRRGGPPKP